MKTLKKTFQINWQRAARTAALGLGLNLASVAIVGLAPSALAADCVEPAKNFMSDLLKLAAESKASGGTLKAESQSKLKDLSARVDFEGLAKKALAAKWTSLKPAERKDFLATLQQLLEHVAYPQAHRFGVKMEDLSFSAVAGKSSHVKTVGEIERERRGEKVLEKVEIVLIFDKACKKIADAVLEGEQLSVNLNRQYTQALAKQSFAEILNKMKKQVEEAKKPKPAAGTPASTPTAPASP